MYSRAARPKLWGSYKNRKKASSSAEKSKSKNKMTPLARFHYTIFGLGMTQGTYDVGRGQFTCVTAALSADIPIVDALPYRLVFRVRAGPAGFRRKSKVLKEK